MEERKEGRKEEVILINVQTPSWQVGKHIGWNKMENNKDGEITHCFYVFFFICFSVQYPAVLAFEGRGSPDSLLNWRFFNPPNPNIQ